VAQREKEGLSHLTPEKRGEGGKKMNAPAKNEMQKGSGNLNPKSHFIHIRGTGEKQRLSPGLSPGERGGKAGW